MPPLSDDAQFLVNFNVQDVAISAGLDISVEAGADILGLAVADMAAYIAEVDEAVASTAIDLLKTDASIQAMVRELSQYKRVLTIGDSITTYRYSYARLLKHLLPNSDVINQGYSGYTSNHGLELTHTRFVQLQPDVVFIKYGVNDCKRFGGADGRTLVSLDEYRGNLTGIIQAFQRYTSARVVLLTPTPVIEPITDANPVYQDMYMTWTNDDLGAFANAVRELSAAHNTGYVDLFTLFGTEPDPSMYVEDGLHPNFAGQQAMLRAIAAALGGGTR